MSIPNGVGGNVRGTFRISAITGLTTGLAVNDTVFSLRWAPAGSQTDTTTRLALLAAKISAQIVTPFTAAQEILFAMEYWRAFTVADTGGTAFTPFSSQAQSLVSSNAYSSLVNDFRVCTTATLTPGTRTISDNPLFYGIGAQVAASPAAAPIIVGEYKMDQQKPTPPILLAGEGFVIRNKVAFGAGGTVRFNIELEWAEFLPNSG